MAFLALGGARVTARPEPALYTPFIQSALQLFEEHGVALEPYAVDASLQRCEAETGSASRRTHIRLSAEAYRAAKIRQMRLVHIEGAGGLQVLNFCIFPALEYGLPTFAADLVTLPGGHLIALDWAPNGADWTAHGSGASVVGTVGSRLEAAFARHRALLPGGGDVPAAAASFFSECFLFSRMPRISPPSADTLALREAVLPAYSEYLSLYLEALSAAAPLSDPEELAAVRDAQLEYQRYRAENDPARGMLTKLFGSDFTERLIHEVLFDLPAWLEGAEGSK